MWDHLRIINCITTSSATSYEYMNRSSFNSLPKQNNRTFSGGVSPKFFSVKYCIFSEATVALFEIVIGKSPAALLIFTYIRFKTFTYTYFQISFVWNPLRLKLVKLIVLIKSERVVYAGNRDPVVDASLVNSCGQAVLWQLQLCSLDQGHCSGLVFKTSSVQKFPNLLGAASPRLYNLCVTIQIKTYPKTPLSTFLTEVCSRVFHKQTFSWCLPRLLVTGWRSQLMGFKGM